VLSADTNLATHQLLVACCTPIDSIMILMIDDCLEENREDY